MEEKACVGKFNQWVWYVHKIVESYNYVIQKYREIVLEKTKKIARIDESQEIKRYKKYIFLCFLEVG